MAFLVWILLFIPFGIPRPVDHDSKNSPTLKTDNKQSDVACYFAETRKNVLETQDRPEKSVVSTTCSKDMIKMGSLASVNLGPTLPDEHPLAVLMCRGAGMCDLDFKDSSVLSQWENVQICKDHADELLRQWNTETTHSNNHIYRHYKKTGNQGAVGACSMPSGLGPDHNNGRPLGETHLSVKGSDAIIKQEHVLVHPGIPICRRHNKYVNEIIQKFGAPPAKKVKESLTDSDMCSENSEESEESDEPEESEDPKDSTYKQPKEKTKRSDLDRSFSKFAKAAGEVSVCTRKDTWHTMQTISRERKARSARKLIDTMFEIMVPDGTEEFKSIVYRKTMLDKDWTTGSSENFENVMHQVSKQFFAAENRRSKLLVLSLVANSTSYLEVVKYIPSLNRYMYQSAKVFGKRKRMEVKVEKKLERYNAEAVQAFVEFITSPTVLIGLPYGVQKVKLSDGHKKEIPNSIRQQSATEVIQMWTNYCQDNDQSQLLLSSSTLYKILQACTATKRESTTCVDYFIAHGMEGFDEIRRIMNAWETEGLMDHHALKQLSIEVSETEQYFRSDFRLHIKQYSKVADHCANFALSDPKDKNLASTCSAGSHKHDHKLLCDRCERANATLTKLQKYAEDFAAQAAIVASTAVGDSKKDKEDLLSLRTEEVELIKKSLSYVAEMKKHLLRSAFTNQEREGIISGLKDNEALVTIDFAQKFLPKFHREKQSEYFGKKGISYHVSHVTARIGSDLVQHSFVHIYSGSVTQDATLVVLTISHFLHQLEKIGIRKISLRSDNAGAYHSAGTIGSLHWLNQTTSVEIVSWSFSEAQNGKSSSDRDANRVKQKAKNYVDKGNNIPTSDDFFTALKTNPLNGVSIYHGTVTPDVDSGKTEWPGISNLNFFTLEVNGLRGRRYGGFGNGVFVEKSKLKPIKGTFKFDDEAGSLASNIVSKEEERNAVLSGSETKFWYHSHCVKKANCVDENDIIPDLIEEDIPATEIGDLFACPEPGCSAVFLKHSNLEKHILRGKHKISPERVTERETTV